MTEWKKSLRSLQFMTLHKTLYSLASISGLSVRDRDRSYTFSFSVSEWFQKLAAEREPS